MADVDRLLELLDLERLDRDLFRARNAEEMRGGRGGRVFGGQVAGQALRAATLTVDAEHEPHSLHGYFLRPGNPTIPIVLSVDRIRDGRSFTTRRVVAIQQGEAIFSLSASFHKAEPGGEYQLPIATNVPDPDDDGETSPFGRFGPMSPLETKEVGPTPPDERGIYESTRRVWVRTSGPVPDDPALRACVLTYISDMGVVMAARVPVTGEYGFPGMGRGMAASLDHSVWFHRDIRPDEWMLMNLRSISNTGARGLVQGTIHARSGALGVAIAQEGLVRTGPPG